MGFSGRKGGLFTQYGGSAEVLQKRWTLRSTEALSRYSRGRRTVYTVGRLCRGTAETVDFTQYRGSVEVLQKRGTAETVGCLRSTEALSRYWRTCHPRAGNFHPYRLLVIVSFSCILFLKIKKKWNKFSWPLENIFWIWHIVFRNEKMHLLFIKNKNILPSCIGFKRSLKLAWDIYKNTNMSEKENKRWLIVRTLIN